MGDYNFDRVSDKYDETRGFPPGVADQIARWILSRLPDDPAITELGVGTGRIAIPFIEAGIRYAGFDISEQMLVRLKEKLGGELYRGRVIQHDIHQPLPLPEASQDAVIAVHILHLVDAVRVLTNLRPVLKPGGVLVWGYETGGDHTPHKRLRDRFHAEARELGYKKRDYHAQSGRAALAEWGSVGNRHVVTAWAETESLQSHLDRLRSRVYSFTWEMTDEQVQIAGERTEAWALAEFGDLNEPRPEERQFAIDWYVLGGL